MIRSLPVLMYHSVSRFKNRLCVSPELFAEHCATLASAGWRGVSLPEAEEYFLRGKNLPSKSCLFTFDDGYLDNYVYAEPILERYGHSGVIFPVATDAGDGEELRPTLRDGEQAVAGLARELDARPTMQRRGLPVLQIHFCNWAELRQMHQKGVMRVAAHSLGHSRVIRSLNFRDRLYLPRNRHGYYALPPFPVPYGFPRFVLGHALACRGYVLEETLFDLIRDLVPQDEKKARDFLADPARVAQVVEAVKALPKLGRLETKEEYRSRVAQDMAACRTLLQDRLGEPCISFCWPWGDYSSLALAEGKKAGFRVFFATGRGANLPGRSDAVRRISVRGGSGEELLHTVQQAAFAPREALFRVRRVAARWLKDWRDKRPR